MEQYEIFQSEGGYRVALALWGNQPIMDRSPWFATKEEAEKARDEALKRLKDELALIGAE